MHFYCAPKQLPLFSINCNLCTECCFPCSNFIRDVNYLWIVGSERASILHSRLDTWCYLSRFSGHRRRRLVLLTVCGHLINVVKYLMSQEIEFLVAYKIVANFLPYNIRYKKKYVIIIQSDPSSSIALDVTYRAVNESILKFGLITLDHKFIFFLKQCTTKLE